MGISMLTSCARQLYLIIVCRTTINAITRVQAHYKLHDVHNTVHATALCVLATVQCNYRSTPTVVYCSWYLLSSEEAHSHVHVHHHVQRAWYIAP
jgi:hypothetical protein